MNECPMDCGVLELSTTCGTSHAVLKSCWHASTTLKSNSSTPAPGIQPFELQCFAKHCIQLWSKLLSFPILTPIQLPHMLPIYPPLKEFRLELIWDLPGQALRNRYHTGSLKSKAHPTRPPQSLLAGATRDRDHIP